MDDVLGIWLRASIEAHSFIGKRFWESRIEDMRNAYIPASDTYVFSENGIVKGFVSLHENTLAALFVSPNSQGKGIGQQLMVKAKSLRSKLSLNAYLENPKSIQFYQKHGFTIVGERIDEHTGHVELLMEYST